MFFLRGNFMKNKKGFTLIELIVVIAILGILALFLVPQFMGYAEDAKMQVAEANVRTVWSAAKAVEVTYQLKHDDFDEGEFKAEVMDKLGSSFNEDLIEIGFDNYIVTDVTYTTDKYICNYVTEQDVVSSNGGDPIICTTVSKK